MCILYTTCWYYLILCEFHCILEIYYAEQPQHVPGTIPHLLRLRVGRHFELDRGLVVVYPMALEPRQL